MKKSETVKNTKYFNKIIQKGKSVKNDLFVINIYNKQENSSPKFGIAVSKKLGNAVVRNKLKRQLRVITDKNKFLFPNGNDYIIIVKRNCLDVTFAQMSESLNKLLREKVNNEK